MDIKSILNSPGGSESRFHNSSSSVYPVPAPARCCLAPVVTVKRQKVAKDAPVFSEGNKIIGHINYPPHEAGNDRNIEAHHREFRIFPLGQIHKKGVRHIPYNSDKKDFLDKTGRDAFEVFQYTYKKPGDDKEYVVVWDYNVGLVRMTPFFKSCKYSKTVPAKALRENPGMKDISYSITGGALVCQGYWMPYQAAREIAATFCWDIRWALTPVFGNDFPHICKPPQHPGFGKFAIDPQIVKFCTAETTHFKEEGKSYRLLLQATTPPVTVPIMPVLSSPSWKKVRRSGDVESGYGSDVDRSDNAVFSPQISPRSQCSRFTPINGAESPASPRTPYSSGLSSPVAEHGPLLPLLPTPAPDEYYECLGTKRTHSKIAYNGGDFDSTRVGPLPVQLEPPMESQSCCKSTVDGRALEAAEALMCMGAVVRSTAALPEFKRTRRSSRY